VSPLFAARRLGVSHDGGRLQPAEASERAIRGPATEIQANANAANILTVSYNHRDLLNNESKRLTGAAMHVINPVAI
jgi:hypothetical protein